MKKIILAVCFLSSACFMSAQIPGYLGKRTVVEVQGMLPLFGLSLVGSGIGLPVYQKVHAEYAIQRKRSVSLEYRRYSISAAEGKFSHQAIVGMYGLYRKNWSLAPYGKYLNIGLGYNILNNRDSSGTNGIPSAGTEGLSGNFLSAHLTWGQRTVIAKNVTFNYGFETGVPLNGHGEISVFMLFNMNLGVGIIF
jgi:hypothetical protein